MKIIKSVVMPILLLLFIFNVFCQDTTATQESEPLISINFQDADIAALQRLTITVKVTYLNTRDDSYDFEGQNFSFYQDYDPEKEDFNSIEATLVEEIYDAIILDIFNASVANW